MKERLVANCENCNGVYAERDKLVALVYHMAQMLGYKSGIGEHVLQPGEEWDPEWYSVVFIELPTGQVSWHIHVSEEDWFANDNMLQAYEPAWDGHTTEEKYRRVLAMVGH
jgi:hypothetical protein